MPATTTVIQGDLDDGMWEDLRTSARLACDVETSGLDPRRDRIGTVQLHAPHVGELVLKVGDDRPERLCALLEDSSVGKVFHHAMFDLRFMVSHWGVAPTAISCTKIASKLLDPHADNERHSLQALLQARLGVDIDKSQRLTDWLAPDLTVEQLAYAAADVRHLLPLLESLEQDLRSARLTTLYEQCLSFIPARVRLDLGDWPDVFTY